MAKKLYKSRNRMLFGVCGGIADYFNWDATVVRIIVLALTFILKLSLVPIYLICALVMPERHIDDTNWQYADDDLKSANIDGEKVHKNGSSSDDSDDRHAAEEAENQRRFAENADKIRTDSEFDSYFKK